MSDIRGDVAEFPEIDFDDDLDYDDDTATYGAQVNYGYGMPPYALAASLGQLGYAVARSHTQAAVGVSQIIGGVLTSLVDASYVGTRPFQPYAPATAGAYGPAPRQRRAGRTGEASGRERAGEPYDEPYGRTRTGAYGRERAGGERAGGERHGRERDGGERDGTRGRRADYGYYGPGAATSVVNEGLNRAVSDALNTFARAAEDFATSYAPGRAAPPPPSREEQAARRAARRSADDVRAAADDAAQAGKAAAGDVERRSSGIRKPVVPPAVPPVVPDV